MEKKSKIKTIARIAVFAVIISAESPAKADPRSYVWTYEYITVREGQAEIEYYHTAEIPDADVPKNSVWKQNIELEYGLTSKTDIALYQNFKQTNSSSSKVFINDGIKLRIRHRLAEKGEFPLDTVLYAEYKRDTDLSKQGDIETKLIFAKDIGRFNLAYNQVIEFPIEKTSYASHYFYVAACWKATSGFRIGVEGKGIYKTGESYIGPTVNLRAKNMKVWTSFGYLKGLNSDSKDIQTRMIIGVPF